VRAWLYCIVDSVRVWITKRRAEPEELSGQTGVCHALLLSNTAYRKKFSLSTKIFEIFNLQGLFPELLRSSPEVRPVPPKWYGWTRWGTSLILELPVAKNPQSEASEAILGTFSRIFDPSSFCGLLPPKNLQKKSGDAKQAFS
jgi:hypothetical protein